jgi:hypothetical protein
VSIRPRLLARLSGPIVCLAALGAVASPASAQTYYVDCTGGNDLNAGTAKTLAWQTPARASSAALVPGDQLLLRKGCVWQGSLQARWSGTAVAPITVDAYGRGKPPLIENAPDEVRFTGSYVTVSHLAVHADPPAYDATCDNRPIGIRVGFRIASGASYITLDGVHASGLYAGVYVERGATHNRILRSTFSRNDMANPDLTSDAGAIGIALLGDDNEVAYNTISGSNMCSPFYSRDGTAVEVYGGQRNRIHHNVSQQNNTFVELGNSRSQDNDIAYNLITSTLRLGNMLVTRGAMDKYGPVYRTRFYNNTGYLTGKHAYAIECYLGCDTTILSMRDNIIWANWLTAFIDAGADEGHNIFWKTGGTPRVDFPISPTDMLADPRFVDPAHKDFRLLPGSPAIDSGDGAAGAAGFATDLAGTLVPQNGAPDIGAFEATPLP